MTLLRARDSRLGGAPDLDRSTRRFLVVVTLGVVLLRATYVLQPLRSDEGGYLLIARQWHSGGEFLYGDYYVDRPPLLMAVFRLAALSDWDSLIRVIAVPFALLFVYAAWWAGGTLGGRAGSRWSALVAAGLMCSPALAADQSDGELFAAAFVMTSFALTLAAWRSPAGRRQMVLAVAAGAFAGSAPLMKQNFLDGVLFIGVMAVAAAWARRGVGPREVAIAVAASLGALMPHAAVWLWARSAGISALTMWQDLAGFRGEAFQVIWSHSTDATLTRAWLLLVLGLLSGVLAVVACWFRFVRSWAPDAGPEHWGISAALLFGLAGIVGGGSYWPHYLLQLAPAVTVAVGLLAPAASRCGLWTRRSAMAVVVAAVAGSLLASVVYFTVPWVWFQQRTGEWLAASSTTGDTAYVAYGHASMLEAADLTSPYPHLWSLPMRTLDGDQARLRETLAGPEAPAWIVQVNGLNSWQIDADSRLRDLTADRYRVVAEVCGMPIWLRHDLVRPLPPPPRC